ncbi:hypothetical protein IMG5_147060 [Ichthyophthirius multifiliis]|uniref:Uncharacterized protein n=1 Tax=Ichthyophthirius multifiliis TaxID=5932 RepID=G0QY37_ICHMU|nr:hypothetical protein IMG5_147060 [Ichthyophthirius multifiliis]EGR29863.1 hypothetical protein IMG5_147060 [Ichthyophthirius multifiliis]|eukprot:XP_004031099.1 hypothetical protein IMG5_147060 [Ichthyophthirius multifiliis]
MDNNNPQTTEKETVYNHVQQNQQQNTINQTTNNIQNQQQNQQRQQNQQQPRSFSSLFYILLIFLAYNMISGFFYNPPIGEKGVISNLFQSDDYLTLQFTIEKGKKTLYEISEKNLQYNYYSQFNKTLTFQPDELFTKPYPVVHVSILNRNRTGLVFASQDLIVEKEKKLKKSVQNLLSNNTQATNENVHKKNQTKEPHYRSKFFIQLIHDTNNYKLGQIPPQLIKFLEIDKKTKKYKPILDLSQFWVREQDLLCKQDSEEGTVQENIQQYNITFEYFNYWNIKYLMINQLEESLKLQDQYGLSDDSSIDQIKEMLIETNPYYLSLTFTVSLLHSVFQFLAIKNDISYWNNLQEFQGLSLRSLYTGLIFEIIVFLYLHDSENTSYVILISSGIEIIVTIWKIVKQLNAKDEQMENFLIFKLIMRINITTEEYDKTACKYLYIAFFPLFIGYTIYSLMYEEHKGWYSFCVTTSVGFIYLFGFINMTPQLYINYKLKSVEHLPWRTMIYKFLNTIVDDLFAFVITMPLLKRLSCFRDDVIFIIYFYQRYIYQVDHKRTEYGFKKEDIVPSQQKPKQD